MVLTTVTTTGALVGFLRRVERSLSAEQHEAMHARDARRLGLDAATWQVARAAPLDLALLRRLHVGITGDQPTVRRTLRDGQFTTAPAQPGKLRTKPQAFRHGEHVEPAWGPGALKRNLGALFRAVTPSLDEAPLREAARVLWTLRCAQPFTGLNERVALSLAAWCLRRAGLPTIPVRTIERDPAYGAALVAATEEDRGALERYLEQAVWDGALALAEWLAPAPPPEPARWTLQDEHEALARARQHVPRISTTELEALARELAAQLVPALAQLGVELAPGTERWLDAPGARLQATWNSATRGRAICPHEPIFVVTWPLAGELGLEATLIVAAAGRGITGAVTAQLVIELADVPSGRATRALLLVPEETDASRRERLARWVGSVAPDLVASAPLRL